MSDRNVDQLNATVLDKMFIDLKLEGGQMVEGARLFAPGDVIEGMVQVEPKQNIRARRLFVCLEWYTEGKGDRDRAVIDEKELATGSLRERDAVGDQFMFRLPEQPWSYAGHYINIVWAITVNVDVPMGRDFTYIQPFVVDPGAPD